MYIITMAPFHPHHVSKNEFNDVPNEPKTWPETFAAIAGTFIFIILPVIIVVALA